MAELDHMMIEKEMKNHSQNVVKSNEEIKLGEFENIAGLVIRVAQLKAFDSIHNTLKKGDADGNILKVGEFTVLQIISQNRGIRQGALADYLQIKWSNMSKLIYSLEGRELLTRYIPKNNRRSVELDITDKGLALMDGFKPKILEVEKQCFSMLKDEEYKTLTSLLRKVADWPES